MKKLLSAIALVLTAGTAQAVTVDFEGIAAENGHTHYSNDFLHTGTFRFFVPEGYVIDSGFAEPRPYASKNGSDWLMSLSNEPLLLHSASPFSIESLDAGSNSDLSTLVRVVGYLANGDHFKKVFWAQPGFSTFQLGWTGLSSVFIYTKFGNASFDNFVLNEPGVQGGQYAEAAAISAVPLPAAMPLLIGGLAAMGFVARRRKRKAD
ncbi:VPLPA-CTERM sorting domain-containing protein [Psychromarinibacter sp. S121]|uniref:VPLPA-CTERM sorting domain-containing protein n=1 Tax=Psychromarinibacter sp. S121 TaxID=3415127 RepID=UPI003C79A6E7